MKNPGTDKDLKLSQQMEFKKNPLRLIFLTPHIWVALAWARWTHSIHLPSGQSFRGDDWNGKGNSAPRCVPVPNVSSPHYWQKPTALPTLGPVTHLQPNQRLQGGCLRGWSRLIRFRSELTMPQAPTPIFIRCRCALMRPGIVVAMRSSAQPAERAWACQCHEV